MLKLLDNYDWYDADINTNGNDPTSAKTCICFTIDTFNKMESDIEQEVQELKDKIRNMKKCLDWNGIKFDETMWKRDD